MSSLWGGNEPPDPQAAPGPQPSEDPNILAAIRARLELWRKGYWYRIANSQEQLADTIADDLDTLLAENATIMAEAQHAVAYANECKAEIAAAHTRAEELNHFADEMQMENAKLRDGIDGLIEDCENDLEGSPDPHYTLRRGGVDLPYMVTALRDLLHGVTGTDDAGPDAAKGDDDNDD